MKTLQRTTIGYKNNRVELSKMKSGRYYISNGCEPLGFADSYLEANEIYENKVRAFKAKRTRELNKLRTAVIRDFDSIDQELLQETLIKDFCMQEESAIEFYNIICRAVSKR